MKDGSTQCVDDIEIVELPEGEYIAVYSFEVADFHTYFVSDYDVLVHNDCKKVDTLNNWLKDEPELLKETRKMYKDAPQWWGIDPDKTPVFYRSKSEVAAIRKMSGESGGYHPHGLALGGPKGQTLTPTNETRYNKNPIHSKVTGLQRRVINVIKKKIK